MRFAFQSDLAISCLMSTSTQQVTYIKNKDEEKTFYEIILKVFEDAQAEKTMYNRHTDNLNNQEILAHLKKLTLKIEINLPADWPPLLLFLLSLRSV